jgi:hypothetical protein
MAQASALIHALAPTRALNLSEVWEEAWERGPAWRTNLRKGLDALDEGARHILGDAVVKGAKRRRRDPEKFWPMEQSTLPL